MKIFAVQLDIAWEDKQANFAKVDRLLADVNIAKGSLIVLPEMFATGFSLNVAKIREGDELPTEKYLADAAVRYNSTVLGGAVTQKADGKGLNQAVAFGADGHEVARYSKFHPFSFGEENKHYTGGDRVVTFACGGFTVAPIVCYDLRFPELFRAGVRRGADLYTVIANWPSARESHWIALLTARAIENQAYVAGVNRCGVDPKVAYHGRSLVIDPRGRIIADGGEREGVVMAELEPALVAEHRAQFPALRDMRSDLFR